VLVVELWKLGDAVIATPALRALRTLYPSARITVLAQPATATVLQHTGIFDEVLPFVFPWTAEEGKYDPRRYDPRAWWRFVRELRARRFDVALAARMDPRDHALLALSGAPRRVGLDHGGGAFFLTDRVPANDGHRVDDWLRLVRQLGYAGPDAPMELSVGKEEAARAAQWLAAHGVTDDDVLVGVHTGASVPLKRWGGQKFEAIVARCEARGARVLVFDDPATNESPVAWGENVIVARLPLREMLAVLARCSMFICNDSGPLHMAAALGVPTVSVFTNQNPELYAPRGGDHAVALREGFACRPCFERCVFVEPYCNTSVSVDDVWPLVERRLELLNRPALAG
jgi:heptosyltransferase-2